MPLLANLFIMAVSKIALLLAALRGTAIATRLAALMALAAIYISCIVLFMNVIAPWWSGITTTGYGSVIGLLFPPAAGTVLGSLVLYWTCVIGVRYVSSLTKAAIK